MSRRIALAALVVLCTAAWLRAADDRPAGGAGNSIPVYIGTFTSGRSKGVYLMHMDAASGRLDEPMLVAEGKSPSFLVKHPTRPILYCVNEIDDYAGGKTGAVSAFQMEADGKLALLNQ